MPHPLRLYASLSGAIERLVPDWMPGLLARLVFASVLLVYFLNSAATKLGTGFPGVFIPQSGAYAQILPSIAEAAEYDVSKIAVFPWKLIVFAGTYAEVLLPLLVVMGLFTRLSALAMTGFVFVMTFVDIAYHGLDAKAIGAPFDRVQDAIVADQRLLWLLPLLYLVLRGPGALSLDGLIARILPSFRY